MYFIKVKGKAKIPDYVQVRDGQFTLIGYFRADRPEKGLEQCGFEKHLEEMKKLINDAPFGFMQAIPPLL